MSYQTKAEKSGPRGAVVASVVMTTVLVAVGGLLALSAGPAGAAFPGLNGRIVFESNRTSGEGVDNPEGDFEIFSMNSSGTGVTQLTENNHYDG